MPNSEDSFGSSLTDEIALLPCPFCGKQHTVKVVPASEIFGDDEPYQHTESYAGMCDAAKPDGPGGCGASGGYALTEAEAVEKWNLRTSPDMADARDAALEQAANLVECEYAADAKQGRRLAQIAQHIRDLKKKETSMSAITLQFDTAADLESALLDALQNNEGHVSGIAAYLAQTGAEAVAPEAKPTDADLIEQFIAHNSQFHRSADHPAWLYCKDGDGGYTSLRGDLFAATLRTLTQGNQS